MLTRNIGEYRAADVVPFFLCFCKRKAYTQVCYNHMAFWWLMAWVRGAC